MNMIKRLFGSREIPVAQGEPEEKQSSVSKTVMMGIGQPIWTERDFENLSREGYMRNTIVFACTRAIANAVSDIPVVLYRGADEVEAHPLVDLVNRPNPKQSRSDFVRFAMSYRSMAGECFIEKVGITSIRELYTLPNQRMRILPGAKEVMGYQHEVAGQTKTWLVRGGNPLNCDILHMKEFHPLDDWYGMGPMEAGAQSVDTHNATGSWAKALLDNSARPSGAFVHTPTEGIDALSDPQFQRLKSEMEANYQGATNAGRPMLLEGGVSWTSMGLTPVEMDFLNTRRELAREIALTMGVPSMLLGIPGDNTFANYQEANRAFYRSTVIPAANAFWQGMSLWLALAQGEPDLLFKPDLDEIPALAGERAEVWAKIEASTDLTVNERREAKGYGPLPGEDGNVIPGLTRRPVDDTPPDSRNDPAVT